MRTCVPGSGSRSPRPAGRRGRARRSRRTPRAARSASTRRPRPVATWVASWLITICEPRVAERVEHRAGSRRCAPAPCGERDPSTVVGDGRDAAVRPVLRSEHPAELLLVARHLDDQPSAPVRQHLAHVGHRLVGEAGEPRRRRGPRRPPPATARSGVRRPARSSHSGVASPTSARAETNAAPPPRSPAKRHRDLEVAVVPRRNRSTPPAQLDVGHPGPVAVRGAAARRSAGRRPRRRSASTGRSHPVARTLCRSVGQLVAAARSPGAASASTSARLPSRSASTSCASSAAASSARESAPSSSGLAGRAARRLLRGQDRRLGTAGTGGSRTTGERQEDKQAGHPPTGATGLEASVSRGGRHRSTASSSPAPL